jgi:predicted phage-related endonuclease
MSVNELERKITKMQEWEALAEEAKAEAESLRDEIKSEMLERDLEELEAGKFIVRWTSVLSNRFDTTAFKKQYGELYRKYTKQVSSRRFSVA